MCLAVLRVVDWCLYYCVVVFLLVVRYYFCMFVLDLRFGLLVELLWVALIVVCCAVYVAFVL